jgi:hypothetical protein
MALEDSAAEEAVIRRHPHVERVICGHDHRNAQARFGGTIASVCPSAAHQLKLNLVPNADIRFTFEPSEFQLHFWNGEQVVTIPTRRGLSLMGFARLTVVKRRCTIR